MADFKVSKGYHVPIEGEAAREIVECPQPPFAGICPVEFKGVKPKLMVKADDEVKVGTPLFFDKRRPHVVFASPASGRIAAINYGRRRVIEEIVIATGENYEYETHPVMGGIEGAAREDLVTHLLKGGLWPFIRQRPFNHIPDPESLPKAGFVNCMDTAPLASDPVLSSSGCEEAFRAGIAAFRVLCGEVHVVCAPGGETPFAGAHGATYHTFSGRHPAGLTGTHINKIDPINKGETVWYLNARDAIAIGSFLLSGQYPTARVVAVAGSGSTRRKHFRTQQGVRIADLTADHLQPGEMRFISGNVLTGAAKPAEGFLGFYDNLVTVIPEGREQQFLGWLAPGLSVPSFTRTYLSGFLPGKKFAMDTNLRGGHRAIIQSGVYDKVVALDVFPEFLVKAIMAEDIDSMEQLGMLECDPEDFALCTYVCPSKTEVSQIIADGLELMEREG